MSLNFYPDVAHDLAAKPSTDLSAPEVDAICTDLMAAASGKDVDDKILAILGPLGHEKRVRVILRYKQMKGDDLRSAVKGRLSYAKALELLASPPDEADAIMIRAATKGAGTEEEQLYPLVCGRSNAEIDLLKKTYFKMYGKDLGQLIDKEVGGDFHKLLVRAVQGLEEEYDPAVHTTAKAKEDAKVFYKAGQGRMGTKEEKLYDIIFRAPPAHLKKINEVYAEEYGWTLFKALEKELGGDEEDGALFALGMKLRPAQTVAKLVQSACKGMGTDEDVLTACVIRYQSIWGDVETAYEEMYGKSLVDRVKKETGGDYERLLVAVMEAAK